MFVTKQDNTRDAMEATLARNGVAVDLTTATVNFKMWLRGVCKVNRDVHIESAVDGIVWVVWEAAEVDEPGTYSAEFTVTHLDGRVQIFPSDGYTTVVILPRGVC